MERRYFVKTLGAATAGLASAAEPGLAFESRWRGTRVWVGPEYWANPLQNWRVEDGEVRAKAAAGRTLHVLTHQAIAGPGDLRTEVAVRLVGGARAEKTWAGFVLGIRGGLPGYQHALVHPETGVSAGVRGDARLFVGDAVSTKTVSLDSPVRLSLVVGSNGSATLEANGVQVTATVAPDELIGNLALAAQAPGRPTAERSGVEWGFRDWKAGGSRLAERPEQTLGPILWTQYTLSRKTLKLMALFPPLGEADEKKARLEVRGRSGWNRVAEAPIEPLSRAAVFRIESWDDGRDHDYRVIYRWQDETYSWSGVVRRDPAERDLRVGVFSCDHGECFPQQRMVRNVQLQDPDVVFFAGDQIYENYGGFGVARDKPAEEAMLDYLRKYWQFGWTWRTILRDRPSIVIPDDHDVFQGNIWGQAGRPLPKKEASGPGFEQGGFLMPVDWVNAVQRTQAGHLPDPVDPAPCEGGIEVYFTEMRYGGASFAILEDRKFKTGPGSILTPEQRAAGRTNPDIVNVDGAEMLGARQEEFLRRWVRESTDANFRIFCSQTIFCKATTHSGAELRRSVADLDCGGWPQKGRRRALEILREAPDILMLHGDQHLGSLVRHGLDDWEDAALAFMVPGTSNGYPRAWWPETPGENHKAGQPAWTGRYFDGLGNRMTILGAANPEPGSNTREGQAGLNAEEVAQIKGSGHGVVVLARAARTATFEMWRHAFDALQPREGDQFAGFPITIELG